MKKLSLLAVIAMLAFGCDGDGGTADTGPLPSDSGTRDAGTDTGMPPMCTDGDSDGYGAGCTLGADCNDGDAAISPAASEACDGVDNDCDTMTDEGITGAACELTEGVCAGAVERCDGVSGLVCDATSYGATYEATETLCDGLDNDCDGTTDEDCTCTAGETQNCGSDLGVCMVGTQTCLPDLTWGPCAGETGPMGESCDGLDNDCDETTDEPGELTAPDCSLQQGVCAGSKRACGGVDGWTDCAGTDSYGAMYEATETLCDGVDNDCNGIVDDGCECTDGMTQACGSAIGACMEGTQTCTAGAFGACAGEVTPIDEICDGMDQDCDGDMDEDVVAPECALRIGVCAGSVSSCGGAGGFGACGATEYGSLYEETESLCDGFDNDCDGDVDETCACAVGETQPCGSSTGACERGTQTCVAGAFGACTGGTEPAAEDCDGTDNDCNGVTDDNLTPPACALIQGVCGGSTQVCGGAAGWTACAGTASYGPNFVATEDGETNELICDGLDNDCDGEVDDDCGSGPLNPLVQDELFPDIFGQHLVYLVDIDGNREVVFSNLSLPAEPLRQLTDTVQDEGEPRVYGNYVVFQRGEGAGARAVLYDLVSDTETLLSTMPSGAPDISENWVVFQQFDGSQWDVILYDISTGTGSNALDDDTSATDETAPSIRGNFIALSQDGATVVANVDTGAHSTQTPASSSASGQILPIADFTMIGLVDGRATPGATPSTDLTDNWDAYLTTFGPDGNFPGETALSTEGSGQVINDIDGFFVVWSDFRNGNWDVVGQVSPSALPTSTPFFLSTSSSAQFAPTISGNLIVWMDNRLGDFDIYSSVISGGPVVPATDPGELVINEILAAPGTVDVTGNGTAAAVEDEFVEIINNTVNTLDLSGLEIRDATDAVRFTFPAGSVLPAFGAFVVTGGEVVAGAFGGAQLEYVSPETGSPGTGLGLNDSGDTVSVTTPGGAVVIDTVSYGSATAGVSFTRTTPLGTDAMILHTVAETAVAMSPGNRRDGFAF